MSRWALILAMLMVMPAGSVTASAITDDSWTGAAISRLIKDRLAEEKLDADPAVNPQKRFGPCPVAPTLRPLFGSWQTVEVSCAHDDGWKIAIRTDISKAGEDTVAARPVFRNTALKPSKKPEKTVRAQQNEDNNLTVAALRRSMSRGDRIGPEDVTSISIPARRAVGIFPNAESLVGRRVKSTITAGRPVFSRQLMPDWLVYKDDQVMIEYKGNGISISMMGIALENGQFGDRIDIRNINSNKVVNGYIVSSKKISVNAKIQ